MKKLPVLTFALILTLIPMTLGCTTVQAQTAQSSVTVQDVKVQGAVGRLSGQDRFQTAKAISEKLNTGTVNDVIITSGNNFPDALSASVLAKKLNAPILLVDSKVQGSSEAFDYISQHLSKTGTVHIIGGTGVIGQSFENQLNQMGYSNIDRIGGYTRYDTDLQIAQKLNVPKNTPVVIASGENFPDALSISSVASSKGWPILLVGSQGDMEQGGSTGSSGMAQGIADFIANDQPSQVYLIGGSAVVSDGVKAQVSSLVPNALITRLAGSDRFDTAGAILNAFSLNPSSLNLNTSNPSTIYLASGMNFPDALAGSALASQTGDPIILIDPSSPTVPPAVEAYLKQLHSLNLKPNISSFGGTAVVPDIIVQNVQNILNGEPQTIPTPPVTPPVTPTPTPAPTGVINSTATSDQQQNLQTIADSLGFTRDGGVDTWKSYGQPTIQVNSGPGTTLDADISFLAWGGTPSMPDDYKTKPFAQQLFKFYLPNDYMKLYNMIDNDWGPGILGKTYTFDNRKVKLNYYDSMGLLEILISKPGKDLPTYS